MSLKRIRRLALLLIVPIVGLSGSLTSVYAQKKEQKSNGSQPAKNACANEERSKFTVKCKDRYFLGELPYVTIAITNTGRSPTNVKEPEYQKFAMEMTGLFQNDSEQQTKKVTYDGSWNIPKAPSKEPGPGESRIWQAAIKREPRYVSLQPGQSTTFELDLSKTFGSSLTAGKYKLKIKSEDGHTVVKEFEVYFDDEKSVAVLAEFLKSDPPYIISNHFSAIRSLVKFSRAKFVTLLEEQTKTGNQKQRDFASEILAEVKAGNFGTNP